MELLLPAQIVFIEIQEGVQAAHHPGQRDVCHAGIRICTADVRMHTREPALLKDGGKELAPGLLPDGGREGLAVFVEGEGLEGVPDVGGNGGIDEGVFRRAFWQQSDVRDAEGADGVPDADGFDGDVESRETELWSSLAKKKGLVKGVGVLGILHL